MPLPGPAAKAPGAHPPPPLSPQTSFFLVREDTKAAVLLHLLRTVMRPQDQTVVFVATKHHAEYLSEVRGALREPGRGCPGPPPPGPAPPPRPPPPGPAAPCAATRGQHQSWTQARAGALLFFNFLS